MRAERRSSSTLYFHALTRRNYRTFWLGQCVSLIGTWVQNFSQA